MATDNKTQWLKKSWALEKGHWLLAELEQEDAPFRTYIYILELTQHERRRHVWHLRFQSAYPFSFEPDETWVIRLCERGDQFVRFHRLNAATLQRCSGELALHSVTFGTEIHGLSIDHVLGNPAAAEERLAREGAPKLGSDLDPHCVGEEQIYRYCARRFDGRAYAREHELTPRNILLHWGQQRDKGTTPTEEAFASFFALEHLHASPLGQLEPATSRLKILQLELFLKLCATPPPAAYQDAAYMRLWKQCFAGILTLCKEKLRRRYEALLQLESKTESFETRLDPCGPLEVMQKSAKRVYAPDMGASLVDEIQDAPLKAIVRSFRDLNRFRVVIDIPH